MKTKHSLSLSAPLFILFLVFAVALSGKAAAQGVTKIPDKVVSILDESSRRINDVAIITQTTKELLAQISQEMDSARTLIQEVNPDSEEFFTLRAQMQELISKYLHTTYIGLTKEFEIYEILRSNLETLKRLHGSMTDEEDSPIRGQLEIIEQAQERLFKSTITLETLLSKWPDLNQERQELIQKLFETRQSNLEVWLASHDEILRQNASADTASARIVLGKVIDVLTVKIARFEELPDKINFIRERAGYLMEQMDKENILFAIRNTLVELEKFESANAGMLDILTPGDESIFDPDPHDFLDIDQAGSKNQDKSKINLNEARQKFLKKNTTIKKVIKKKSGGVLSSCM
ncbi:hypothetical protein ACFL6I_14355 [candidate division KSB1 bacterium]